MTEKRTDVLPFEYVDVGPKIPNYTPGAQWGTQDEPLSRMQRPLPAEESIKHFVTPVGFEVQLFASEPELGGKPIAMNWDHRGRLWVCETYDYPNELQPPGQGRDRIRICEDTDGDGRADRFTVFAEGLSIPTAILCYRGGALVQNGIETLFLKDTDGDDRADVRRVLISGWSLDDTHGGVSNFHYGLDNWVWAMQGYNNSAPVVDGQRQQRFRMGFFRFRLSRTDPPQVEEIEFLRSTDNNTWGLGFSEEGLVFGSTANRNPSVYMPIPNRYYERVRGWSPDQLRSIADTHRFRPITENVRQVDHHGGYTAGAGHALYTARTYPQQWWNQTAFVCGPTGHLVGTFLLEREGADFRSTSPCNLLASDDQWTAPIMAEVGPDGNVWVIDWYNFIVQHNPTPRGFETGRGNAYESDLRDKQHGRVYRVVYTGSDSGSGSQRQATVPLTLDNASASDLVATLRHPTMLWRKQAQRLLVERGESDVAPQLLSLVQDESLDEIGLNVGAIHALWTLAGLADEGAAAAATTRAAIGALSHPAAGVRRNALAVLPPGDASTWAILSAGVLRDEDPQVQLAALLALADMPENHEAALALASLAIDPAWEPDRWRHDALTSAAAAHATRFLPALAASFASAERPGGERALAVSRIVAEHVARGELDADTLSSLLSGVASAEPAVLISVLDGFAAGWPRGRQVRITDAAAAKLAALRERLPAANQAQLVRLGVAWGSPELEAQAEVVMRSLRDVVGDSERPIAQRVSAAAQMVEFRPGSNPVVDELLELVTPQAPPRLAEGVLQALSNSTADALGPKLVDRASAATPALRYSILPVLLARRPTANALLDGFESGVLSLSDLSLDQKRALTMHPDRALGARARALMDAGGNLPNPDRQRVLESRLALAERTGDVAAGKAVYSKHCAKCHRHGSEGENIGPDLTGMAVHPKTEMLTHILDPSRDVESNFRLYTVVTEAGRLVSGMLAAESRTSLELVDTEGKRHQIQRSEIDQLVPSRNSVMPDGFEQQASEEELVNLLEFLANKGPYLPLDLRRVATVSSVEGMFTRRNNRRERLDFLDWGPKHFGDVPFYLVDPQEGRAANVILLYGPFGAYPPTMPKQVSLPVNTAAQAIHFLSGISGWGYPSSEEGSVSLIVRLHYADGSTEDHPLVNGQHFADYARRVDVPQSQFAFGLRGRQVRYLVIRPGRSDQIAQIELVKGPDNSAPVVMAITVETAS